MSLPTELSDYNSAPSGITTHDKPFASITKRLGDTYAHLQPSFFEGSTCLHAKIDIYTPNDRSLLHNPGLYADVLQTERFMPVTLTPYDSADPKRHQQYILSDSSLQKLGFDFELSASFGASFIAIQLKTTADLNSLEVALCYALQVIDKLHERINRVATGNAIKKLQTIQQRNRRRAG